MLKEIDRGLHNKTVDGNWLVPVEDGASVPDAQTDAIRRLIGIIRLPMTGNDYADFMIRKNQVDAARALLQVKTRMLGSCAGSGADGFILAAASQAP